MSQQTRNLVIGVSVSIAFLALLSWQGHRPHHHPVTGWMPFVPCLAFGYITYKFLGFFSGNREVTNATDVERQAALADPPPAGHGLVYVYRDAFTGRAVGFDILIDSLLLAQLKSPRFARLTVPAGNHLLTARRPKFGTPERIAGHFPFSLGAGESAIFRVEDASLGGNSLFLSRAVDAAPLLARFRTMKMVLPDQIGPPVLPPVAPPPKAAA